MSVLSSVRVCVLDLWVNILGQVVSDYKGHHEVIAKGVTH